MYRRFCKRLLDVIGALLGLVLALPVLLLAAIAIKLDSPGPVLFRHRRLGLNGRGFRVIKLRTMVDGAYLEGERTAMDDARITRVGSWLRRTSIDELPQLVNVLLGDMSLIGPRPGVYREQPSEFERHKTRVRPGLTGLAQVNGRSNLGYEQKRAYDLEYVDRHDFAMDLRILLKTAGAVLKSTGTN